MATRARFVTFEGIDGSGKTTLARLVAARLRREGLRVKATREETPTWLGAAVRKSIARRLDPMATLFLFLADRAEHTRHVEAWLDSRRFDVVLSDRYADSTLAYQSVTLADRLEGAEHYLRELHEGWALVPDRTFLLLVPPRVALARLRSRKRRAEYEKEAFLRKVTAWYRALAGQEPRRFVVLDGTRDPEALAAACWRRLRPLLR